RLSLDGKAIRRRFLWQKDMKSSFSFLTNPSRLVTARQGIAVQRGVPPSLMKAALPVEGRNRLVKGTADGVIIQMIFKEVVREEYEIRHHDGSVLSAVALEEDACSRGYYAATCYTRQEILEVDGEEMVIKPMPVKLMAVSKGNGQDI